MIMLCKRWHWLLAVFFVVSVLGCTDTQEENSTKSLDTLPSLDNVGSLQVKAISPIVSERPVQP